MDVHCLLCSAPTSEKVLELRNSPLLQNRLFASQAEAVATKRTNATYFYCRACHFAFNPAFDRTDVDYATYYNEQIESPLYKAYVDGVALELSSRLKLGPESRITEIGCGSGYFLSRLKAATGSRHLLGIDPSYRGEYGMQAHVQRRLLGAGDLETPVDLIVLRHCLEGLLDLETVMELIRRGTAASAHIYVEINDLDYILSEQNPSLLFHEYYQYFSARAADVWLRKLGFRLNEVRSTFGGCYLGITASRGSSSTNLADAYRRLEAIVREHRKVVIWGIGGRSISLLSHMAWDSQVVAFGVDIDTKKQGMYLPVTGQRILSPAEAVSFEPDLIIVPNQVYGAEIRQQFPSDVPLVTLKGQFI